MIFYQTELWTETWTAPPNPPKVISFSDTDSPETWEIHTVLTSLMTYKSIAFICHENLKAYAILICSVIIPSEVSKKSSSVSDSMKNLKTWYSVHRVYYSTVGPYHIPISNSTTSPTSQKVRNTFTSTGQYFD
jgi:hypothetical protein